MAHELIAVERSLGGALRRLRRFTQGSPGTLSLLGTWPVARAGVAHTA